MPDGSPVPTLELMFDTYIRAHSLKPTASFTFENSNGWKMKFPEMGQFGSIFRGKLAVSFRDGIHICTTRCVSRIGGAYENPLDSYWDKIKNPTI